MSIKGHTMDGVFEYLEGLTFYGTLTAIFVAFGVWYFWWHILPKIRVYDHSKRILNEIVPKIGEDIDKIEKNIKSLETSVQTVSSEIIDTRTALENNNKILKGIGKYLPKHTKKLDEIQVMIDESNRQIIKEVKKSSGRTFVAGFEEADDITPDTPFSLDPDSHIGESTEDILDELTIEDIKGLVRKDRTLQTFSGQERRRQPNRRSGSDRRQKTVSIRADKRSGNDRRSGRDRRDDRTIGHLQKLGKIVDALNDDTATPGKRLRRKSRIDSF